MINAIPKDRDGLEYALNFPSIGKKWQKDKKACRSFLNFRNWKPEAPDKYAKHSGRNRSMLFFAVFVLIISY